MDPLRSAPIGQHLQYWRKARRMSQLELALDAQISPKHLSFLETGRSHPSREMLQRLSAHLDVPKREQNAMFISAGYAPQHPETALSSAQFDDARRVIELILRSHDPHPALAIDRHWNVVMHNHSAAPVLATLPDALRTPQINILRISLHPNGIAPLTLNFGEWRAHLLRRLKRQIEATQDAQLIALQQEVLAYPHPDVDDDADPSYDQLAVPLVLKTPNGVMRYLSTTLVFGSPVDITLSELAIETFFPASDERS
jgi:transcriptional regulator with XRE-family HTH domain